MSAALSKPLATPSTSTRVTRFLREKARAGAVRVELRQVGEGDRESAVDTWPIDASSRPDEIARELEDIAQSDSTAIGGVNVYAAIAFDAEGRALGRSSFRLTAEAEPGAIAPTEKATLIGMRAQEMRHNEMYAQLSANSALDMIENYRVLLDDYRGEVTRLRSDVQTANAKQVEFIGLYESLVSERAARELEAAKARRLDEAQREILDKLKMLWPIVVHKLAGAPNAPFVGHQAELLKVLLANVSRAEIDAMASALPIDKRLVFWEVLRELLPAEPANGAPATSSGPSSGEPS
jgi:hypothetical protein